MILARIPALLATLCAIVLRAEAGGLAMDAAGNAYFVQGNSVWKLSATGGTKTPVGTFKSAIGLCVDDQGTAYVSESDPPCVYKITPQGKNSIFAKGIASFGLASNGAGELLVAAGSSILKFDRNGSWTLLVSDLGNAGDLGCDAAGNLYVLERDVKDARVGRQIYRISPGGEERILISGLHEPSALAVDREGNIYVAEEGTNSGGISHVVHKYGPDGLQLPFTAELGSRCSGLALDRAGQLLALQEHVILRFDDHGKQSKFAATSSSPDGRWAYESADDGFPRIVAVGQKETVLDLSDNVPHGNSARVLWAPDSKHFAFNYSPSHAPHTRYETTDLYELKGDRWVLLDSPLDASSSRAQIVQLLKDRMPKGFTPPRTWNASPEDDTVKLTRWIDGNSARLDGFAAWSKVVVHFRFTLKLGQGGKWQVADAQEAFHP